MSTKDVYLNEASLQALAAECRNAPLIRFALDAGEALQILALLQLALRHPAVSNRGHELVHWLADQLKTIGPAFARAIELGFNPTHDV